MQIWKTPRLKKKTSPYRRGLCGLDGNGNPPPASVDARGGGIQSGLALHWLGAYRRIFCWLGWRAGKGRRERSQRGELLLKGERPENGGEKEIIQKCPFPRSFSRPFRRALLGLVWLGWEGAEPTRPNVRTGLWQKVGNWPEMARRELEGLFPTVCFALLLLLLMIAIAFLCCAPFWLATVGIARLWQKAAGGCRMGNMQK